MSDRREFFRLIAQAGGESLLDWLGAAVRSTGDRSYFLSRLAGLSGAAGEAEAGRLADPDSSSAAASAGPPPTADLWLWPGAPVPFPPVGTKAAGQFEGPSQQVLTAREIAWQHVLFAGVELPGDGWLVLPASLGALCGWQAPVGVVAVAGHERLELRTRSRPLPAIRRIGVALGHGHEAWVRALWRTKGLPEPEVVAARPEELDNLERAGAVDALLRSYSGGSLPVWALVAPRAWSLPDGWGQALSDGWQPLETAGSSGRPLRWLHLQLKAVAELGDGGWKIEALS